LDATLCGRSVLPNAGKPRQILALLALNAGSVLSVDTLMEEIWGQAPPRSARTTLQTYILQLRRTIDSALPAGSRRRAKEILATRHGGYLLQVEADNVDAAVYGRLSAEGNRAFERGQDKEATEAYRRALDLWRGPSLVDVRLGPYLESETARLEESRLGVLERKNEAGLRLGRHFDLLTELAWLVTRHPFHEGLYAQYMVALHRSGRSSQALDVFTLLRERLSDELGIDPSQRLRHLHRAILSGDPALDLQRPRAVTLDLLTPDHSTAGAVTLFGA
jgi:DNA-binding SARP family transcriptional activator